MVSKEILGVSNENLEVSQKILGFYNENLGVSKINLGYPMNEFRNKVSNENLGFCDKNLEFQCKAGGLQ